jgi:hypothetical protein
MMNVPGWCLTLRCWNLSDGFHAILMVGSCSLGCWGLSAW